MNLLKAADQRGRGDEVFGRGGGAGYRRAHIASLDGTDFGHDFPRITRYDPVSATTVPIEDALA